jgi:hypothetical protein
MKPSNLDRLLWLREQRTLKALEKLTAKQSILSSAERLLGSANDAVERQVEIARERERAGLNYLMGRVLNDTEIAQFRGDLGALDHQATGLRELRERARKSRDLAKDERLAAATDYRLQQAREEKLKRIMELQERQLRRKKLTLAEVADEDAYGLRPGKTQDSEWLG